MGDSQSGCERSSLLGHAFVLSLSLWIGLSLIYRFISILIAPSIEFKHCLCLSGYSYYAWCFALLISYFVESSYGLSMLWPLVLIGIPSAISQVILFLYHIIMLLFYIYLFI